MLHSFHAAFPFHNLGKGIHYCEDDANAVLFPLRVLEIVILNQGWTDGGFVFFDDIIVQFPNQAATFLKLRISRNGSSEDFAQAHGGSCNGAASQPASPISR